MWDVGKHALRAMLAHASGRRVAALAFSPDSGTLAVAVDEMPRRPNVKWEDLPSPEIVLWEAATARKRNTLTAPPGLLASLAYSLDGRSLVSGGIGTVLLWDMAKLPVDK